MESFYDLREFCLLKDSTDPARRSIHREVPLFSGSGMSMAEDTVLRYDIAKELWLYFGDDGPPKGTRVWTLHSGHGGGIGCERFVDGSYEQDPRYITLVREGGRSLVVKAHWWACITNFELPWRFRDLKGIPWLIRAADNKPAL